LGFEGESKSTQNIF